MSEQLTPQTATWLEPARDFVLRQGPAWFHENDVFDHLRVPESKRGGLTRPMAALLRTLGCEAGRYRDKGLQVRAWRFVAKGPVMPTASAGVDPGKVAGGFVVLGPQGSDRRYPLLYAASWREHARWWKVETLDTVFTSATLHEVGREIADEVRKLVPRLKLAVEGQFIWQRGQDLVGVDTTLTLARCAGLLAGPLTEIAEGEVLYPTARDWRPRFKIRTNVSADVAAKHALTVAPALVPGLAGTELGRNEHVAEAALLAVYADQSGRVA